MRQRVLLLLLAIALLSAGARPSAAQTASVPAAVPRAVPPPPDPGAALNPVPGAGNGAVATQPTPPAEPPPPHSYRPRTVIGLTLGADFGGDELGTGGNMFSPTENLRAGDGLLVSADGSLTPWWLKDRVGLGAGVSFGWKYNNTDAFGGGASFSRFPVAAFAHILLQVRQRWLMLIRGGPMKLLADGPDVVSSWGAFVDLGACRWFENQFGLEFLLRYTHLDLTNQSQKINADSLGFALGVLFGD